MVLNLDKHFKPIAGKELEYESFTFNGGEPHIRIKDFEQKDKVQISHRINSFNDLGLLLIAIDALKRMGVEDLELIIPYFPCARQDRVMVNGESLSVKVVADLLNAQNLQKISIYDPHSDVTPALLNNCRVISNHKFVKKAIEQIPENVILISPDAGASKKTFKLSNDLGIKQILECGKKRDIKSGKLSGFTVPKNDLNQAACLIVDDICDGGGTFLGLAKELKNKNAGNLYLAISHGIFSKGFDELNQHFKKIFTTNSIKNIESDQSIIQLRLQDGLLM